MITSLIPNEISMCYRLVPKRPILTLQCPGYMVCLYD